MSKLFQPRNAILARTSLATAASSATSAVSCGHQASETEQGGGSAVADTEDELLADVAARLGPA